jgi:hypothetical protein
MRKLIAAVSLLTACGEVLETASDASPDDGRVIDSPDGQVLPTVPPVTIGQAPNLAIGAPDLATRTSGTTADTSRSAGGLCVAGERMWISDFTNARALQFNAPVLVFSAAADLALGQTSLTTNTNGPTNRLFTLPTVMFETIGDVACDGTVVVVSDSAANRVVIYNAIPGASGAIWNTVLGQTTTTGAAAATSANGLSNPRGVWTDGTRIVVADTSNHRVLIWSTFPTANGTPADVVLGQASFNVATAPTPPTPSSMNQPLDVFFDGERLYVSDSQNNRVMGWNGMPTQNNQPADFFVGQAGGSTGSPNAAAGSQTPNAIGLHIPGEITVAHGSLFIVDMVNFRVVGHTPRPTASGTAANSVLGASDFMGGDVVAEQGLTPRGLAVQGDKLWISDSNLGIGGSRVVRYQLANLP